MDSTQFSEKNAIYFILLAQSVAKILRSKDKRLSYLMRFASTLPRKTPIFHIFGLKYHTISFFI